MSKTYTIEIEVEVKMTHPGYPATGPSYSSGGEPGAGPEFEIGTISFVGDKETVDAVYKKAKDEAVKRGIEPARFDQYFADMIYDKALDKAAEDDWSDDDGMDCDE